MVWKDKEWMKVGSKWKCKVGTYIVAYFIKWLLTNHLKEVHGLMAKNAKFGKPLTFERSPQHQDHAKMNVCMLRNAMAVQSGIIKKLLVSPLPKPNTNAINR
jgi:hypothetical protein